MTNDNKGKRKKGKKYPSPLFYKALRDAHKLTNDGKVKNRVSLPSKKKPRKWKPVVHTNENIVSLRDEKEL